MTRAVPADELTTHDQLQRLHPVNLLDDAVGRGPAYVIVLAVGIGAAAILDALSAGNAAAVVLVVTLIGVAMAAEPRPTTREDREARLEQATDAYVAGRITHAQFEQRVGFILDDRNVAIRRLVEGAEGVGPKRSAAIAAHFTDVDAVLQADVDELTGAHGVGDEIAASVRAHLQAPRPLSTSTTEHAAVPTGVQS